MWVFTKHGFLSIVQHKDIEDVFQVKGRNPEPLLELFPEYELIIIDWADYRYRIEAQKEEVIRVMSELTQDVDYTNFKNECYEEDYYHHALVHIWNIMYGFQSRKLDMEFINRED